MLVRQNMILLTSAVLVCSALRVPPPSFAPAVLILVYVGSGPNSTEEVSPFPLPIHRPPCLMNTFPHRRAPRRVRFGSCARPLWVFSRERRRCVLSRQLLVEGYRRRAGGLGRARGRLSGRVGACRVEAAGRWNMWKAFRHAGADGGTRCRPVFVVAAGGSTR